MNLTPSTRLDCQLAAARRLGISSSPLSALIYLSQLSPATATATAIARHIGVSTASVTGLVDRLAKAGLVRRDHGTADRRLILVTLTAAGRAALTEITAAAPTLV